MGPGLVVGLGVGLGVTDGVGVGVIVGVMLGVGVGVGDNEPGGCGSCAIALGTITANVPVTSAAVMTTDAMRERRSEGN